MRPFFLQREICIFFELLIQLAINGQQWRVPLALAQPQAPQLLRAADFLQQRGLSARVRVCKSVPELVSGFARMFQIESLEKPVPANNHKC